MADRNIQNLAVAYNEPTLRSAAHYGVEGTWHVIHENDHDAVGRPIDHVWRTVAGWRTGPAVFHQIRRAAKRGSTTTAGAQSAPASAARRLVVCAEESAAVERR